MQTETFAQTSILDEHKIECCPDCGSDKIESRNGEDYCVKCGYVIE